VAINREALCDRILQGQGMPAGDLGPDRYFGTSPDLTPQPFNPDGARRLLAEAGYAQGFAVQAIAQIWSRIGMVAKVETRPRGVWHSEAAQLPPDFTANIWAMRRGLSYQVRTDEMTLATSIGCPV
jgi:peptide/nickel transport system substrate-binding protein